MPKNFLPWIDRSNRKGWSLLFLCASVKSPFVFCTLSVDLDIAPFIMKMFSNWKSVIFTKKNNDVIHMC